MEIYNMRESLGMSQQKLAQKAKTTQKVISRIENGDVNLGFALLNRIANVLNFNYKNWDNIFNFNIPYNFLFIGSETVKNISQKIEKNILSNKFYSLSIKVV